MANLHFQKIDSTNIGDHTRLRESDDVYFLREYTSAKNFSFSETNDLISNLKKKKGSGGYKYKAPAIERCATEILGGLRADWLKTACLVPIPPSKCSTDPAYDDRMLQMCNRIAAKAQFPVDVREIVKQKESIRSAHESSDRPSVDELIANYQIDEALCAQEPQVIGIVDDVLTVGNHLRAMSNVLSDRFPHSAIFGIFVARRVIPRANFEDFVPDLDDLI